jgi:hypothetical protein
MESKRTIALALAAVNGLLGIALTGGASKILVNVRSAYDASGSPGDFARVSLATAFGLGFVAAAAVPTLTAVGCYHTFRTLRYRPIGRAQIFVLTFGALVPSLAALLLAHSRLVMPRFR